jgi:hypothetical protein
MKNSGGYKDHDEGVATLALRHLVGDQASGICIDLIHLDVNVRFAIVIKRFLNVPSTIGAAWIGVLLNMAFASVKQARKIVHPHLGAIHPPE